MAQSNPTKKQHFLPQFYLRRFANSQGVLHIYDKSNNRITSPHPASGIGYENYFYAVHTGIFDEVSQQIEEWLKTYEGIISKELPGIIGNILNYRTISDDEKYILASLMCMLWLRTPAMRDKLNRSHEDLYKQMNKFNSEQIVENFVGRNNIAISKEERESLILMLKTGKYAIRFNNAQHLRFMTESFGFNDKGFINMFYGQKWKIYIAKGERKFITSENPIVEWWLPPDNFYGTTFLERTKYFALTPEIFIELTYPQGSTKMKRKTLYDNQEEVIREFNLLIASRNGNYVYAGEKTLLEEIMQAEKILGS